jgi:hypothetical protein
MKVSLLTLMGIKRRSFSKVLTRGLVPSGLKCRTVRKNLERVGCECDAASASMRTSLRRPFVDRDVSA